MVVFPASPTFEMIVIVFGTIVRAEVARRADVLEATSSSSKTGPSAKPIAGSAIAAVAIPPAANAPPVKSRRRVSDSPSKYPGGFAGGNGE